MFNDSKYKEIRKQYSTLIAKRTYNRYDESLGRRETWTETVDRYANYMRIRVPVGLQDDFEFAVKCIHEKQVMPSMRLLWTAGKACDVDNVCAYNCSYIAVKDLKVFSELMYLLMNGVGVGLSVEQDNIKNLPSVSRFIPSNLVVHVGDSKEGWASSFNQLLEYWFAGIDASWDLSQVRPKGATIKTFGGKASGGEVLNDLFSFTRNKIFNAQERKLSSDELADIACMTANIVLCGGKI